jgi:hypothetical protein
MLMRRLDLLLLDPKRSLFKTNKTRNTTIKNSNKSDGGDDGYTGQRWHVVERTEEMGHNTLEGGRKWPELLHMAEKHLKNTKKTREKHVEEEEEIRKGRGNDIHIGPNIIE